jgi:hypothetical protein
MGCDEFTALFGRSGVYQTVEIPGAKAFLKIGPSDEYVEVVSLGLDVYISSGKCKAQP